MNPIRKKISGTKLNPPHHRIPRANTATVQRKVVAPAPYRPQSVPRVLQTKAHHSQPAALLNRAPAAPNVYRPQTAPKVLQLKKPVCVNGCGPVAPQVYRPQPIPKVLQTKPAIGRRGPIGGAPKVTTTNPRPAQPGLRPASPAAAVRLSEQAAVQRKLAHGMSSPGRNTIQLEHFKDARKFTPMDLQTASFSTVTAMLHIDPLGDDDWECHGKFTSDKSGHAEEQLLDYLRNDVYYGPGADAKVVIELTTSPCGEKYKNCAQQLINFTTQEAEDRGIAHVHVKALGFYKSERDAMVDATEIKSTEGMDFEIWDVQKEIKEGPQEGYDNYKSLQNFAEASIYQVPKANRKTDAFDKVRFNQDKFGKFLFQ